MKLTKRIKEKGAPAISRVLQSFEVGESAAISIEPSVHSGMPFHNFQGYTGIIAGKQGRCYLLDIHVGSVKKRLVVAPVHLKRIRTAAI
ncbi:MAG: 50S ribosomal protein L21e [Candidatus Thermoplasmatota archaeon]|jgi:large subunit ribosomal protein L21e|nr:50S ribosomal protein L21e [Candidatus Thermoplasmatota archaeon]MCL5785935.1 50S ribosomal protein L21e [Candidatus Thermoplasmatota archaeon]